MLCFVGVMSRRCRIDLLVALVVALWSPGMANFSANCYGVFEFAFEFFGIVITGGMNEEIVVGFRVGC